MSSRNVREGRYLGRYNGKHTRGPHWLKLQLGRLSAVGTQAAIDELRRRAYAACGVPPLLETKAELAAFERWRALFDSRRDFDAWLASVLATDWTEFDAWLAAGRPTDRGV